MLILLLPELQGSYSCSPLSPPDFTRSLSSWTCHTPELWLPFHFVLYPVAKCLTSHLQLQVLKSQSWACPLREGGHQCSCQQKVSSKTPSLATLQEYRFSSHRETWFRHDSLSEVNHSSWRPAVVVFNVNVMLAQNEVHFPTFVMILKCDHGDYVGWCLTPQLGVFSILFTWKLDHNYPSFYFKKDYKHSSSFPEFFL